MSIIVDGIRAIYDEGGSSQLYAQKYDASHNAQADNPTRSSHDILVTAIWACFNAQAPLTVQMFQDVPVGAPRSTTAGPLRALREISSRLR